MKNFYTLLVAMMGATFAFGQFNVTFQVDMNNETVSGDGVHIAGGFQGWDPAGTPLTDDDMDGVYEVTLSLEAGDHEFKFINGNDWPFEELVPDACRANLTGNTNRKITVSEDMTYSVCFGSCAACGMYTVRFLVDMSQEDAVAPQGVHVAGDFQGWDPGATELSDPDADLLYEVIYSFDPAVLPTENELVFKYINGNDWPFPNEDIPAECGDGTGNRLIVLDGPNTVTSNYCFNSCGTCVAPTDVTFRVDMSLQTVSPNGVHIAGAFQGWNPGADEMTDDDADGIYEITLPIAPGTYEYKFVNGNAWDGADNDNESVPAECNSNGNRLIEVVDGEEVTVTYCYNQCTDACVADPDPADITFSVNMQDQVVDAAGVWLIGGFTNPQWQAGATQMTDDDADGIYTCTVNVSGSADIQYKFTNGDPYPGGTIDDTVGETYDFTIGGCGVPNGVGGFNRTHVRSGQPETLDVVCYDSCVNCGVGIFGEEIDNTVSVYPNPTADLLYVTSAKLNGNTNITLIDAQGRVVLRDQVSVAEGARFELDLSGLENGVYTLQMNSGSIFATRMVVKK